MKNTEKENKLIENENINTLIYEVYVFADTMYDKNDWSFSLGFKRVIRMYQKFNKVYKESIQSNTALVEKIKFIRKANKKRQTSEPIF